jgi:hypothetical protein
LKQKLIEKYADLLPEEFSIIENIKGANKHVQARDFVACDSCISIQELQCTGKLSFQISLINDSRDKYVKEYNINIKGDDKL